MECADQSGGRARFRRTRKRSCRCRRGGWRRRWGRLILRGTARERRGGRFDGGAESERPGRRWARRWRSGLSLFPQLAKVSGLAFYQDPAGAVAPTVKDGGWE